VRGLGSARGDNFTKGRPFLSDAFLIPKAKWNRTRVSGNCSTEIGSILNVQHSIK
jgi:hypothetical protein